MSYNTRNLKTDISGKIPIPQYFNPEIDNYEALYGANGASRAVLYDKDGNPLFSAGNPARVSDETTQQKLDALQTELQAIKERLDEPMPTELTGSIVKETKYEIETVSNAVSVAPSTHFVTGDIPAKGADEIWVLISSDQQPWSLRATGGPWVATSHVGLKSLFPIREHDSNTFTVASPARCLLVYNNAGADPAWNVTNVEEAYYSRGSFDFRLRFDNGSDSTATATLKVLRVWR